MMSLDTVDMMSGGLSRKLMWEMIAQESADCKETDRMERKYFKRLDQRSLTSKIFKELMIDSREKGVVAHYFRNFPQPLS